MMSTRVELLSGTETPLVIEFGDTSMRTTVSIAGVLIGNIESIDVSFTASSDVVVNKAALKVVLGSAYGRASNVNEATIAAFKAAGFVVDVRVLTDG